MLRLGSSRQVVSGGGIGPRPGTKPIRTENRFSVLAQEADTTPSVKRTRSSNANPTVGEVAVFKSVRSDEVPSAKNRRQPRRKANGLVQVDSEHKASKSKVFLEPVQETRSNRTCDLNHLNKKEHVEIESKVELSRTHD